MPNWCEGTLKVRGKIKDLKKFIFEGLTPVDYFGHILEPLKVSYEDEDEGYWELHTEKTCYIENTSRGFVEGFYVYLEGDEDETNIICLDSKFSWGITATELQKTCTKCHVDMKIYAFERGMEFNQDIEIVDGNIIKDEEISFEGKDYAWECICPGMGG